MTGELRRVRIDRIVIHGVDFGPAELLELRVALRRALRHDPAAAPGPAAVGDERVPATPVALAAAITRKVTAAAEDLR